MTRLTKKLGAWLAGMMLVLGLTTAAVAQQQSTCEQIKETGKVDFAGPIYWIE